MFLLRVSRGENGDNESIQPTSDSDSTGERRFSATFLGTDGHPDEERHSCFSGHFLSTVGTSHGFIV